MKLPSIWTPPARWITIAAGWPWKPPIAKPRRRLPEAAAPTNWKAPPGTGDGPVGSQSAAIMSPRSSSISTASLPLRFLFGVAPLWL
jgi:hypothetical protein